MFGHFYTYSVVFSLYLAIIKKKKLKKLINRHFKEILLILINVDKARGGRGAHQMWIKKIAYCESANVDKGGGVRRLSTKCG